MQLSNSILHFFYSTPGKGKTKSVRWEKLGEEGVKAVMEGIAVQKLVWPSATTKKYESDAHSRFQMLLQCCTYETLQPVKKYSGIFSFLEIYKPANIENAHLKLTGGKKKIPRDFHTFCTEK